MPTFGLAALVRALLVWLVIIAAESAQGALRRLLFSPQTDLTIRQASVVLGALMIFAITWLFRRWMLTRTAWGALAIGVVWVVLTVAFEAALGRLTGMAWDRIAADYDLGHGGMMPLGLLAMALTPWTVRQLQAGRARRKPRGLSRP